MALTAVPLVNLISLLSQLERLVEVIIQQLVHATEKQGYGPISRRQLVALCQLQDGMTCMDMARLQGISKQAVSLHLNQLCTNGYLQSQENQFDHRSTQYFFTPQGLAIRQAVDTCWRESESMIDAQLGPMIFHEFLLKMPRLIKSFENR